jgi:hypothetical protein
MNANDATTKPPLTTYQLKLRETLERRAIAHREASDLIFHLECVQRLQAHLAERASK